MSKSRSGCAHCQKADAHGHSCKLCGASKWCSEKCFVVQWPIHSATECHVYARDDSATDSLAVLAPISSSVFKYSVLHPKSVAQLETGETERVFTLPTNHLESWTGRNKAAWPKGWEDSWTVQAAARTGPEDEELFSVSAALSPFRYLINENADASTVRQLVTARAATAPRRNADVFLVDASAMTQLGLTHQEFPLVGGSVQFALSAADKQATIDMHYQNLEQQLAQARSQSASADYLKNKGYRTDENTRILCAVDPDTGVSAHAVVETLPGRDAFRFLDIEFLLPESAWETESEKLARVEASLADADEAAFKMPLTCDSEDLDQMMGLLTALDQRATFMRNALKQQELKIGARPGAVADARLDEATRDLNRVDTWIELLRDYTEKLNADPSTVSDPTINATVNAALDFLTVDESMWQRFKKTNLTTKYMVMLQRAFKRSPKSGWLTAERKGVQLVKDLEKAQGNPKNVTTADLRLKGFMQAVYKAATWRSVGGYSSKLRDLGDILEEVRTDENYGQAVMDIKALGRDPA